MKFRKKPIVIEAILWNGSNRQEVNDFCNDGLPMTAIDGKLSIKTTEGTMFCNTGDWIIKEPAPSGDRQFYPCKPDIFEATYEAIEE